MIWKDTHLSWNPSEYLGIEMVQLESKFMWTPVISVAFADRAGMHLSIAENIDLSFDGKISSRIEDYVNFRCEIIFNKYPFDSQQCSFGLIFTNYDRERQPVITIEQWNSSIDSYITPFKLAGEWVSQDFRSDIITDASRILHPRYTFKVKRRSTYYVITIIFPLILTSSMIPLVFLIPPETGEKISYLVALFTSSAIFLNFIRYLSCC
ncbi:unnamed protein product [Lymnaea stagnalis]|uniref:Neurotransmitter-gated ion-channel ligand-binding domain-containing protein n=1 Tax=Lymnaea stagnalis TaxID=6523 RepID=A0AAV2HYK2_LYMST